MLAKYDIAEKASVELREENKIMSSKLKELKSSKKELREKHDKLEGIHNELTTSYNLLKEDVYTKIWEEECGNSKLPRSCHQRIDCINVDIS